MTVLIDLGFEDLRPVHDSAALPAFVNESGLLPIISAVLTGDLHIDQSGDESDHESTDHSDQEWSLSIQLLSAEAMQTYNRQYRGKDKPTNVLSFPFERPQGLPPEALIELQAELGDIFICPAVLAQEALDQQKSLEHHWMHIVIHGVLHLLGHDHMEPNEAETMEALEVALLADFGIDDPYQTTDGDDETAASSEN